MTDGKRIAVVMPAYNAERTLEKTALLSESPGVQTFIDDTNYGHVRNQQTRYREARAVGAGIVITVHIGRTL